MIELSRYPFSKSGSIVLVDGSIDIGEIASNRFLHLGCTGPFRTAAEYFGGTATQYLDLIADGQVHYRCPLEAYFFYTLLQSHSASLSSDNSSAFFLKHVDDKGDHLLVDEDYNIVGVIDWQFARTGPACEAFGPSLLTADLNNLYSGKGGISVDDRVLADAFWARGSELLAGYMGCGSDLVRRFQFGIPDCLSVDEAREILRGMLAGLVADLKDVDMEFWIAEQRAALLRTSSGRQVLQKIEELMALQE